MEQQRGATGGARQTPYRKRKCLTVKQKLKIIEFCESNKNEPRIR